MSDFLRQSDLLRKKLDANRLEQMTGRMVTLGAVNASAGCALKCIETMRMGNARSHDDFRNLCAIIQTDPALCANVLSSASQRSVDLTLDFASILESLGLGSVEGLILGSLQSKPPKTASAGQFDQQEFAKHCLVVGIIARQLALLQTGRFDPKTSYTLGLLHDIGKAVFGQMLPEAYSKVVQTAFKHQSNISSIEREIIGQDHSLAGLYLARKWHLGSTVEDVIWFGHQPLAALPEHLGDREIIMLVHLADTLARKTRIGFSGNFADDPDENKLIEKLGFAPDAIEDIVKETPSLVEKALAPIELFAAGSDRGNYADPQNRIDRLAQINAELCAQIRDLSDSRDKDSQFNRLIESLDSDSNISQLLGAVGKFMIQAGGVNASTQNPLVIYVIDKPRGQMLSLFIEGQMLSGRESENIFTLKKNWSANISRWLGTSHAADIVTDILENPGSLGSRIDLSTYDHLAFSSQSNLLGGIFCHSSQAISVVGPLLSKFSKPIVSLFGIVESRRYYENLARELSTASQEMSDSHLDLAELKTMEAVGDMAAGAGHELNNPLAVISGRAQVMKRTADNEKDRKTWEIIEDQAQRISDVISDLMFVAAPEKPDLQDVLVSDIFDSAVKSFQQTPQPPGKKIDFEINISDPSLSVHCDFEQIQWSICELITNACQAGGSEVQIILSGEIDEIKNAVLITVNDNGPGMSQTLVSAFTPFVSAQKAGRRRGMGLPRVKSQVQNNNGKLWIKTHPGEGTTVFILLPAAPKAQ